MRIIDVMHHLDVTYDVQSLNVDQFEELLPQLEFRAAA